jgi:NADPH2:quinone reductase
MLTKAFLVHEIGDHTSLKLETVETPNLRKRDVLIRNAAIGLNFFDIEYRRGSLKSPKMPFIPGMEGIGEIVETGENVPELKVGQRVAYGTALSGAYAEYSVIDADLIFPVPKEISNEQVVSILTKGMTAHYLMRRTFYVKKDMWVLIHAAAGGVGHIMTALAKNYGAKVIAICGNEKAGFIQQFSPDYVINYENFDEQVLEITGGRGVNVVYDSVGETTMLNSIKSIANFGLMVSFGQSSGIIKNFPLRMLAQKSLFLACPRIRTYKRDRKELVMSALEVFGLAHSGVIPSSPQHIYGFEDIPTAHVKIEKRETCGSQIVIF